MSVDALWNKALEYIRAEMTELSYTTWVKNVITPSLYDGEKIVLSVPSDFYINNLSPRYNSLIQGALNKVSGKEIQLQFTTGERKTNEAVPAPAKGAPLLNQKYTFETFVIGDSNRFAHAASLAVAESPANAYNPLFLYGGVGLGKTHLMHAIGHYVYSHNPSASILYVTSEKFTNDLISSIQTNSSNRFREHYRNADVLLVDDIQFIAGKESTQEEFFHTFNALYEANKQIVISSDKPPKEIPTLEERLRSRFEWGLSADIQKPDFETRVAILRKKALGESLFIEDSILQSIAGQIESNIRELEGSLTRVVAYAALTKKPVTLELVEEVLKDYFPKANRKAITIPVIQQVVAEYYDMPVYNFKSKKRTKDIAFPRQIAMYICRNLTDTPLLLIGEAFGGRDHSTVMYACDKIEQMIKEDSDLRNIVSDLIYKIKE
ncbi:MAG: chromosomal replication initiator protein DnaA [Christensenellales bacterium]|jgi:chromosomal replication initiator protein